MCEVIHVKCSYFTYCKNVNNYTTGLAQGPLIYSLTCTHRADEAVCFYTDRQEKLRGDYSVFPVFSGAGKDE